VIKSVYIYIWVGFIIQEEPFKIPLVANEMVFNRNQHSLYTSIIIIILFMIKLNIYSIFFIVIKVIDIYCNYTNFITLNYLQFQIN